MNESTSNRPDSATIRRIGTQGDPLQNQPVRVPNQERMKQEQTEGTMIPDSVTLPPASLQKKRRPRKKGNLLIALGLVLILLLSSVAFAWIWLFSGVRQVDLTVEGRDPVQSGGEAGSALPVVPYDQELTNILLIGVDSREEEELNTNSDTMMILTLDQRKGQIKLTSFQRDMLLKMPGQEGFFKLNSAMFSGPQHLLDTLNYNFKLDLKDYLIINMRGAEDVVDAMGGLDLDMPGEEEQLEYLNSVIWDTNKEMNGEKYWAAPIQHGGRQHLNGRQSIAFARMRKLDSDFVRMQRQQTVLKALFEAFKQSSTLEKLQVLRESLNLVTTNVSNRSLLGLALACLNHATEPIATLSVPMEGFFDDQIVNGSAVIIPHIRELTPRLHEFLYGQFHDNGVEVEEFNFSAPPVYIPAPDESQSADPWSQLLPKPTVSASSNESDSADPDQGTSRGEQGNTWMPGFRRDEIIQPTVTERLVSR